MEIEFEQEYLWELYYVGKTSNKKHRFQPQVVRQYIDAVNILKRSINTESLYSIKSRHCEKKKGDLKCIEAVYVNMQYRLEFISRLEIDESNTITICSLIELSSHYQK